MSRMALDVTTERVQIGMDEPRSVRHRLVDAICPIERGFGVRRVSNRLLSPNRPSALTLHLYYYLRAGIEIPPRQVPERSEQEHAP